MNNLALTKIQSQTERLPEDIPDLTPYVKQLDDVNNGIKALTAFKERVTGELKAAPGHYGGMEYGPTFVKREGWDARDLYNIYGDDVWKMLPKISASKIGKKRMNEDASQLDACKMSLGGYERITARKVKDVTDTEESDT